MTMFLVTCVCDEGVGENSFLVVEADSRLAIAGDMLSDPYRWRRFLERTTLWWDLTYYEYKYGEPRGWSAADLLARIDATSLDGGSRYQTRIHEVKEVQMLPDRPHVVPRPHHDARS